MIIIIDTSEIRFNRASAGRNVPFEELDLFMDIINRDQLTRYNVEFCTLLIVTDRETSKTFRVFKDRYDIFKSGNNILHPIRELMPMLDWWYKHIVEFDDDNS